MTTTWVPLHLVIAWQGRLIERFGGAPGIRDPALLEGALARPQNFGAFEPEAGIQRLAALYVVGLTKAHGFVDGNKRIGFAVMVAFLKCHSLSLDVSEAEATEIMQRVADGSLDEGALAAWLQAHCRA